MAPLINLAKSDPVRCPVLPWICVYAEHEDAGYNCGDADDCTCACAE